MSGSAVDYSSLAFSSPPKPAPATSEDLLARVVAHLQKNINNRPKGKKTLIRHLLAVCGKSATGAGVDDLLERLCKAGVVSIGEKEVVTYRFDSK